MGGGGHPARHSFHVRTKRTRQGLHVMMERGGKPHVVGPIEASFESSSEIFKLERPSFHPLFGGQHPDVCSTQTHSKKIPLQTSAKEITKGRLINWHTTTWGRTNLVRNQNGRKNNAKEKKKKKKTKPENTRAGYSNQQTRPSNHGGGLILYGHQNSEPGTGPDNYLHLWAKSKKRNTEKKQVGVGFVVGGGGLFLVFFWFFWLVGWGVLFFLGAGCWV